MISKSEISKFDIHLILSTDSMRVQTEMKTDQKRRTIF